MTIERYIAHSEKRDKRSPLRLTDRLQDGIVAAYSILIKELKTNAKMLFDHPPQLSAIAQQERSTNINAQNNGPY